MPSYHDSDRGSDRKRRHSRDRTRRTAFRDPKRDRSPESPIRRAVRSTDFASKGPPRIDGLTSLKVDNISQRTSVGELERLFSRYGELGDVYLPRHPTSIYSRGFAFVRFLHRDDAIEAMNDLDGTRFNGRIIKVSLAKYGRPGPMDRMERRAGRKRQSPSR